MLGTISGILYLVCLLYFITLLARFCIDWVLAFARSYRPTGLVLVVFETVFTLTDPPVKALRRLLPPLRFGAVALDLSILILVLVLPLLMGVLRSLALSY